VNDESAATRLQAWLREDAHTVPEDTLPALRALVRLHLQLPASVRDIERDLLVERLQARVLELTQGGLSRTQAVKIAATGEGIAVSTAWSLLG
jgi:hypothetical protein